MTPVVKKTLSILFKIGLLVLLFTFIYHQYLAKGNSLKQFKQLVSGLNQSHVTVIMTVVIILMLLNYITECLKWQYLTRQITPISLWQSIEGVFCGLSWAMFTPNRLGEFGGRVMFLPPRKRIYGVFAMAVGALCKNVVFNVFGAAALLWFVITFLHFTFLQLWMLWVATILFMAISFVLYFNIKWLVWLLNKISFLKKYNRFFEVMSRYKFTELANIMGFCLARFFIFSFQYYLVIHLLVPTISFIDIMLMVFLVLFIQSTLPSLDLIDVAVRSTAAATVFAYITNQEVAIIVAFTLIWLINLIIPGILGSLFIFKLKFFDRNS